MTMNSLSDDRARLVAAIGNEKKRVLMLWVVLQTLIALQSALLFLSSKHLGHHAPIAPAPATLEQAGAVSVAVLLGATLLVWGLARAGAKPSAPTAFKGFTGLGLILAQMLTTGGLLLTLNLHDLRFFVLSIALVWTFDLVVILPRCLLYWRALEQFVQTQNDQAQSAFSN